ncbi:hypothetical protein [Phenylobacterium sp.]|uniref:hypothetical protein n=1 Tax=Phenylobacterium sp. TaxID=1871053 RepID=UPI002ED9A8B5
MLTILAAATVASAAGPPAHLRVWRTEAPPAVCKSQGTYEIADPALLYREDGRVKLSELGDLPKANHEKAVVRMIGPCANPLVVRYGAGR